MMSNNSSSTSSEKLENEVSNKTKEHKMIRGLIYALGPFPDEPILSAIDTTLSRSTGLGKNFKIRNETNTKNLSSSFDCPMQCHPTKLADISKSCPNLALIPEETLKEKIDFSSKGSSISDLVTQCLVSEDSLNRMWVQKKTTQNGIKSYEIWSEEICQDSPSMIFILSPGGEVIPFEYLSKD